MAWYSGFVVYAFVWFITFLVVLPLRTKTQGEMGDVTPGTPSSAPADPQLRKKVIITTIAATIIWAGLVWFITSGVVSLDSIDVLNHWING